MMSAQVQDKVLDSFLSFQIVLDNSCHFRAVTCNISALASLMRQRLLPA